MKVGDAALELWLESDPTRYCLDVVSDFDGATHAYSWGVDFYIDENEETEPLKVAEGTESTFEKALGQARDAAFKHQAAFDSKRRNALMKKNPAWKIFE